MNREGTIEYMIECNKIASKKIDYIIENLIAQKRDFDKALAKLKSINHHRTFQSEAAQNRYDKDVRTRMSVVYNTLDEILSTFNDFRDEDERYNPLTKLETDIYKALNSYHRMSTQYISHLLKK